MKYFIKGNYYFDFDRQNQLRIAGPQNHLLLGFTFPSKMRVKLMFYDLYKNKIIIKLRLSKKVLKAAIPIVTDIRTIRTLTEGVSPKPTFFDLAGANNSEILPNKITKIKRKGQIILQFVNKYNDEFNKNRRYGIKMKFPASYKVEILDKFMHIESEEDIEMVLESVSNIPIKHRIKKITYSESEILTSKNISTFQKKLYKRSFDEVSHLLMAQKTSSFEYGTIFPRDWIESADLGEGDFSKQTIDYMYKQAMKHISEKGEAWHEDIVGAYREKISGDGESIDRKMIDIEPHYIMGMNFISKKMLLSKDTQQKLRLVGDFVLRKAEENELITFKRIKDTDQEYYKVGDWRDSYNAFPGHKSPLAPSDVNCVFYPTTLKIIKKYHEFFQISDLEYLEKLIEKWDRNKQKFRMYHPGDIVGYTLALHGKKNKQMPIAHLDESYDLFYSVPSMEEVYSFAVKLIDPDFFYTPVGPILVANDEDEFTTKEYHGKVIWPKQAAFAVAGLSRQLRRGVSESWPQQILETISDSIKKTCQACFRGWRDLKVVPELYYYDAKKDKARLYTDQDEYEGQMSLIQLWSLVGLRRIMRDYVYVSGLDIKNVN